jgi:heptosyltransferase-3
MLKRALVIKLRHHGDVLLSSPVFSILNERGYEVDAFIYEDTKPMLEGHPAIANFLTYDRGWKKLPLWRRLIKEAKLLNRVRKSGYDLVVNLTEGDRGALAALVSGAEMRVGFDPEGKGFKGKKSIYTHVVKNCPTPRHAVERNLDALRKMGIVPNEEEKALTFHIPDEAASKMSAIVGGDYVVVHAVARWKFKCPPPALMKEVVRELISRGLRVVVTGSPDPIEIEMAEKISVEGVINLAGKTSLKELGALIKNCHALITVDTVALHMASALKIPTVAIFGPTSELNWGPWQNPQAIVVTKKIGCRPCGLDGCGGSKISDCLQTLSIQSIVDGVAALAMKS